MAHHFYPLEYLGFDQQAKREAPLTFPRADRRSSHQDGVERRASCMSAAELDSKSRNPGRRRIQVACNRCRKRKIKCSGDTGDGQGCSNCRSSGNTNCHFLRVNSSMLQTKLSQWPYPAANATVSPSRMGMYASKHTGFPINSPNVRVPSFSRPAGYDGMFDQNVYERQSFSVDQGINHEDDQTYQSPGYMMPSSLPDYSGIWNQKAWNPNPNLKTQNGAIFPDQDENPVPPATYPYMLPNTGTSPPPEIPPVVPTMALPSDGQSQTERTLPNPANRQVPASMPVVPAAPDAIPTLPFGNPWAARAAVPSARPSMPISSGCFSSTMNRRKPNQPTTAQDMAFGYLPINTTTDPSPPIQSTSTPGMDPVVDTSSAEPRVSTSFSRDNTASNNTNSRLLGLGDYTPDIYGYSTSERSRVRGSGSGSEADDSSSATLLNGLPYTRVRHPEQPNSALAFNLLPTEPSIPEYRPPPPEAQRAVSPLGSNGF
ncbi:hemagglutinin protein [Aspergillus sp. HF37]|nr:hemagglutinin protein [Aspergillus sp. HF37]